MSCSFEQFSVDSNSAYWTAPTNNEAPDLQIGFNETLYKEILSLPPMPTPTSANEERSAEGHAVVDKVTSRPAKMPKSSSLSRFVSSTEVNKSLHPPTLSASRISRSPPAVAHPTFQSTTASGSGLSNISPQFASRPEAGTSQPTNFFNSPSTSKMSDTNVASPESRTTFQSQFSQGNTFGYFSRQR